MLEGRGWSVDDIKKNIISRVKSPELKGHLETLYGTSLPEGEKPPPAKKEGEQ
jgi:hypothetical protein